MEELGKSGHVRRIQVLHTDDSVELTHARCCVYLNGNAIRIGMPDLKGRQSCLRFRHLLETLEEC
jgi:hypothetical protein